MRYILSLTVIAAVGALLFWSDLFVSQEELEESKGTEDNRSNGNGTGKTANFKFVCW